MWERSHETAIRDSLIAYNVADCTALQCLCNHLSALSQDRSTNLQEPMMDLVNVDEIKPLPPFLLINKDAGIQTDQQGGVLGLPKNQSLCPH